MGLNFVGPPTWNTYNQILRRSSLVNVNRLIFVSGAARAQVGGHG